MKAEVNLLPSQPQTHLYGSRWREWFHCEDFTLTNQELQKFYTLKQQSNLLFEGNQRWDLIKTLYTEYFQQPAQVSGKQWQRLGFQGQYPETDFRGGGILSLELILRFVRRNKELVKRMQKDPGNFFFAITAINITFFLKKYFHLADFLVAEKDFDIYCNRRALKNFCRILVDKQSAFSQIHETMLKNFYLKHWEPQLRTNQNILLKFNSLFDTMCRNLKDIFEASHLVVLKDFLDSWNQKYS